MAVQESSEAIGTLIEHVPLPNLAAAHVLIITCGTFEFDKLENPQMEYWPHAVRTKLEKEMRDWFRQHPHRKPLFVSTGFSERTCFLVVHHAQT